MLQPREPLPEHCMSIAQAVQITLLAVSSVLFSVRAEVAGDTAFLRQAAQWGLAEVAASKMALVKSRSPTVKSFADAVLADHARLHEQLQTLAADADVELPVGLTLRQKLELRLLRDGADDTFDERFANTFGVKAYERTIRLFEAAATDAQDPDVQAFAVSALPWLRERLVDAKGLSRGGDGLPGTLGWIGR
jgi:putative membrane protein